MKNQKYHVWIIGKDRRDGNNVCFAHDLPKHEAKGYTRLLRANGVCAIWF